jgi:DNA-binding transcriptional regulator PaaX
MKTRNLVMSGVAGAGLLAAGIVIAQNPPAENIDPNRHPHLAAAQHHIRMAFDETGQAQHANDWDMSGHAAHARELLDQAARELKAAAEAANRH